jgi:hypothetical protein
MAIAANKKLKRMIATPILFKRMPHYNNCVFSNRTIVLATAKGRAKGRGMTAGSPPTFEGNTQQCYPPWARPAERCTR